MTQKEKNEAIAKILGFKQYGITVNGKENAETAWQYPKEYAYLVHGMPMRNCPDFIGLLKDMREIKNIVRGYSDTY